MKKKFLCCTGNRPCNASCRFYRFLECLSETLKKNNYRETTIHVYIRCIQHFFRWFISYNSSKKEIDKAIVKYFITEHLPVCSCYGRAPISINSNRAALNWLIRALRDAKIIHEKVIHASFIDNEIDDYRDYLIHTCGVSMDTLAYRIRYVREFLTEIYKNEAINIEKLTPYIVLNYVLERVKYCSRGSTKVITTALRSYLKFLTITGRSHMELQRAVPVIPHWKLSSLPVILPDVDIDKILSSFNRFSSRGKRDYAIALCYADLGLRTSEITELTIDNINWHSGVITVPGTKSRRERLMPLPHRTGKSIAIYLRNARPTSNSRILFLRHRGAVGYPVSRDVVRGVLRRAFDRCEVSLPKNVGPHVFRHTLAGKMIQRGCGIKEIADMLGHKSIETSMIYTKIDMGMLSKVVLEWPEVRR